MKIYDADDDADICESCGVDPIDELVFVDDLHETGGACDDGELDETDDSGDMCGLVGVDDLHEVCDLCGVDELAWDC